MARPKRPEPEEWNPEVDPALASDLDIDSVLFPEDFEPLPPPLEDPRRCGACDGIGRHERECPVRRLMARKKKDDIRKPWITETTEEQRASSISFSEGEIQGFREQARAWLKQPEAFRDWAVEWGLIWLQIANASVTKDTTRLTAPEITRMLKEHGALAERVAKLVGPAKGDLPANDLTSVRHGGDE